MRQTMYKDKKGPRLVLSLDGKIVANVTKGHIWDAIQLGAVMDAQTLTIAWHDSYSAAERQNASDRDAPCGTRAACECSDRCPKIEF